MYGSVSSAACSCPWTSSLTSCCWLMFFQVTPERLTRKLVSTDVALAIRRLFGALVGSLTEFVSGAPFIRLGKRAGVVSREPGIVMDGPDPGRPSRTPAGVL